MYPLTYLSVQFSNVKGIHIAESPENFSSCKTEIFYLSNNSPVLPVPDNHHSTLCL